MPIRFVVAAVLLVGSVARGEPPARRTIAELVETPEPAWPDVKKWIAEAKVDVKVLPATRADGEKALVALQVTARSPMGAIALESCGLMLDRGWLRVLGAGCKEMPRSIAVWNELDSGAPRVLVVAMDAIGGLYGVNTGGLEGKPGDIFYFSPQSLRWEAMGGPYTSFLRAALSGELTKMYDDGVRWKGWEKDVSALGPDQGMHDGRGVGVGVGA